MDEPANDTPEISEESEAVRPEEIEPNGPLEGLVTSAVDKLEDHLSGDPAGEAHEIDPGIGVEEEGIESSQLFGMMLATILSIAALVFALYFMFFVTQRDKARGVAEDVPADRYIEQRELRAEAENVFAHYSVSPEGEGRFRIPIDAAMQLVDRASIGGEATLSSRVDFNMAWLTLHPAAAIQSSDIPEEAIFLPPDSTAEIQPEVAPPAEEPAESATEEQ